MKKILVILVALIGFGFSANASTRCDCGATAWLERKGTTDVLNIYNGTDRTVAITVKLSCGRTVTVVVGRGDTNKEHSFNTGVCSIVSCEC